MLRAAVPGICLLATIAAAEHAPQRISAEGLRSLVDAHALEAIALYREFLAIPNDANDPQQIQRLNAWVREAFESRGFETREPV
jgi:hypothetical protein